MKTIYHMLKIFSLLAIMLNIHTSFAQLSGTKTIGSAPSDYTTFSEAADALVTSGVNGPVVFNVKAGIYAEQLYIENVPGASSTNTITFQSEDGDSTSVDLTYSPFGYSDNFTLWLFDSQYITFRNLTISSGGNSYACVIIIDSLSGNNSFLNNRIIGYASASASEDQALIYSSGYDENNNTFTSNNFLYGSYGLYYYGTANKESGTVISNNIFEDQYYSAIYLSNQDGAIVTGNLISRYSPTSYRAIQAQYCDNHMVISKNKIDIPSSAGGYGMYITNCDASAGNEALISNNFVHINTTGSTCKGINCISSNYQKFYFNSVNVTGSDNYSSAFAFEGYGSNEIWIMNNIFSNKAGGEAIYCYLDASLFTSDYNDFYTTGTVLCDYYGNMPALSDWITATGMDGHTRNVEPGFISDSDLHCSSAFLSNIATPISEILDDIDGELRGSIPDIGADEFEFTGMENFSENQFMQIYPNPTSSIIYIEGLQGEENECSIVDLSGRLILNFSVANYTSSPIDISEIPDGYYFLKIKSRNQGNRVGFVKISD